MHPYGPSVPRAGLVPGAAAALEQARRRQDAKNRRRFVDGCFLDIGNWLMGSMCLLSYGWMHVVPKHERSIRVVQGDRQM